MEDFFTEGGKKHRSSFYSGSILQLETDEARARGDILGGDVFDFDKGKCIQLKAVTAASADKFAVKLREAADQLKGDVAAGKREIPPARFRRVADIRIMNAANPAFNWDPLTFAGKISDILSPSQKYPTDAWDSVDIVRVTAGFGKRSFRIAKPFVAFTE